MRHDTAPRPLIVLAMLALAIQPAAGPTIWVLQAPNQIVAYDATTQAVRGTVTVPRYVIEHPEYLAVSSRGQLLFALPAGLSIAGGELEQKGELVWAWDGRTVSEWPRDPGRDTVRQWFLSNAGDALYAFETRMLIDRDAEGLERSMRVSSRLLRSDFGGRNAQTVVTLADLPLCRCETGTCSETCPVWDAWAPDGVMDDQFLATRVIAGQLQTEYQESVLYRRTGQTWARRVLPSGQEAPLALSSGGRWLVSAVLDAGCCGWMNESSDQLLFVTPEKSTVLFDEWALYANRNYDAGFRVETARFNPSGARLAYTIVADVPAPDQPIRLSSEGKADPQELARIRSAAARHPIVEVTDIGASARFNILRAELVGWLDDGHVAVSQNGRLSLYDSRGTKTRDLPIAARRANEVFIR